MITGACGESGFKGTVDERAQAICFCSVDIGDQALLGRWIVQQQYAVTPNGVKVKYPTKWRGFLPSVSSSG